MKNEDTNGMMNDISLTQEVNSGSGCCKGLTEIKNCLMDIKYSLAMLMDGMDEIFR